MNNSKNLSHLAFIAVVAAGCSRPDTGKVDVDVGFDDSSQRVLVKLSRSLEEGETAFARVRQGEVGELDCTQAVGLMARIDGEHVDGGTYRGPAVDPQIFEPIYDESWLCLLYTSDAADES